MRDAVTQSSAMARSSQERSQISQDGFRWAVGAAIVLVTIALFIAAVIVAPASVRANNTFCFQQVANDEHLSLEAFFQNPTQQDILVQAATLCSR